MAFTGVAVYSNFANEIGEGVSDLISLISPHKTKFLDDIGDGETEIENKVYGWTEDSLLPDNYTNGAAITSNAGGAQGIILTANADLLRVKDIIRVTATEEMFQVVSIGTAAATIFVQRGYAGTTATSLAITENLEFLGSAVEEGAGIRVQRRVNKLLKQNFTQTFREDISVSTLDNNAVFKSSSQPAPFDEEKVRKTTEVLKQLEKTVLMGRTNGNTIGASGVETTMAGIYNSIVTNIVSHATFTNSILNNMLADIDNGTDLEGEIGQYALYSGKTAFRKLSNSRAGRVREETKETTAGLKKVTMYDSDFGSLPVSYIRWLPTGSVLAIRKDFVKVRPFRGNSFASKEFDNGEMARTGYVAGTYGLEFHQEAAHGRLDGIA